jgi:hypothetical protein
LNALLDLARFLELHTEPALLLGPDGEQVPLPEEIYRILVSVVEGLREGKVITVVPQTQRLTSQEAADFLGRSLTISRAGTAGSCFLTCSATLPSDASKAPPPWTGRRRKPARQASTAGVPRTTLPP